MEANKKEIRVLKDEAEVRVLKDSRTVEGYALVFNSESRDLGGFREVILPQAIEGVLGKSDIYALLNHNKERGVLARWEHGTGSLKLTVDQRGLKYSFEAPKYDLGDELLEGIRRGEINSSSFAFSLDDGGDTVTRLDDGMYLRTIHKFYELYDVSPCHKAAYVDTTVAMRNLENLKSEDSLDELKDGNPDVATTAPETHPEKVNRRVPDSERFLRQKNLTLTFKI